MSKLTKAIGAAKLLLKAKAPTLMVVGGVAAMGTGTVVACKQTLKVEEVMSEFTPFLEQIQTGERLNLEGYTTNDARADRIKVYTRTAVALGRLYAVPAVLIGGGVGLVFTGHRILVQRNATLALAFTGLKKSFDAYRGRVQEKLGDDADQAFMNGSSPLEIRKKNGKSETVASRDWDESALDPYNRVFEQGASESWQNDLGVNKMFVHQQQRFAQERLNRRGHLYLSEVYEALGFPESDISRVVGWKVRKNVDGSKDFPMVDFGLDKQLEDDWKYNQANAIYLDFNCQGLIVGGKLQKVLERA